MQQGMAVDINKLRFTRTSRKLEPVFKPVVLSIRTRPSMWVLFCLIYLDYDELLIWILCIDFVAREFRPRRVADMRIVVKLIGSKFHHPVFMVD